MPHTSTLSQASAPVLPALKRVSLHPPSSHIPSSSTGRSQHEDDLDELQNDEEIRLREDADSLNEIIMAIEMKDRGTLGCAYYIAREERLYMMEDVPLAGLDLVDTLKVHIQPTTLLISTTAEEALENYLAREARRIDGDYDESTDMSPDYLISTSLTELCARQHLRVLRSQRSPSVRVFV